MITNRNLEPGTRLVATYKGYADYQAKTSRVIPLFELVRA